MNSAYFLMNRVTASIRSIAATSLLILLPVSASAQTTSELYRIPMVSRGLR